MPIQLKNPNSGFPPDGFSFSDPHTAMKFDDEHADLNTQIARVIEHRKANPGIYPTHNIAAFHPASVAQEIIVQVCSRHPQLCEDSALVGTMKNPVISFAPAQVPIVKTQRPNGQPCSKCNGDDFEPIYCKTCSGNRITGWRCKKCGST